jgi:hypothetical protein
MLNPAHIIRKIIPEEYRPIGYLTSLTRKRTRRRIRSGPFAGMQYGMSSVGSAYIPKLLGIYERELAAVIENLCVRRSQLIVDIGAAEGYYAVGLAIRNPWSRVIAFEMEAAGRTALRNMALLNGVASRIEIRGKCEPVDLESALVNVESPFVICDVEGNEESLLDPAAVPTLKNSSILVEMHDFVRPGLSDAVRNRFEPTHDVRLIGQQPRSRTDFPWRTLGTALLPGFYLDWAVSEWRPVPMTWLWMQPLKR